MNTSVLLLFPFGTDPGLLSKAISIAPDGNIHVLIPKEETQSVCVAGISRIHTIARADIPVDDSAFAKWLGDKIKAWGCNIILAPATIRLRNIMPMLAWQLKAGLTADCTDLSMDGEQLLQTRPAFGNSLIATIKATSAIQMATVRPGTFPAQMHSTATVPIDHEEISVAESVTVKEFTPFADGTPLSQANIIISGGLGIGSKEGFEKLDRLAQKLGAAIAASRNAVDAGFSPFRNQVGMTGITVCPKLYIAVGISGAVQHLAGMSGSDKIIAINSDPKAPIFDYADYGIVSDWEPVIDKLLEELK